MQLLINLEMEARRSGAAGETTPAAELLPVPTIHLDEYLEWGEFDEEAYLAARRVDRMSGPGKPGMLALSPQTSIESVAEEAGAES